MFYLLTHRMHNISVRLSSFFHFSIIFKFGVYPSSIYINAMCGFFNDQNKTDKSFVNIDSYFAR